MATVLERIAKRIRGAKDDAEAVKTLDALMGEGSMGEEEKHYESDGDNHIHVHLEKGGGGEMRDDVGEPESDPDMGGGGNVVEQIMAKLEEIEQRLEALEGDEEHEVELESQGEEGEEGTKDKRRFTMRRGSKLKDAKTGDEDIPVPERNTEMTGETDLPGVEDLESRKTGDRRAAIKRLKLKDSADMEFTWQDTMALAELIQPGVRVPVFDAKLQAGRTQERLCAFRRRVMDHALQDADTKEVISETVGSISVKTLDCSTLKMAFNATANAIKMLNNNSVIRSSVGDAVARRTNDQPRKGPPSPAEMNRMAKEYWKKSNGAVH